MFPAEDLRVCDGRLSKSARRIALALSLGCLLAAAGMLVACLAKLFQEASRRTAEKEAAGQNAAPQQARIEHDGPMTVRSLRQADEHGMRLYDGDVRIDLDRLSIRCQHVQREVGGPGRPLRLAGYGGVVIQGVPGFPSLKADNFVFDSRDGGLLTLAGEVQVEGPDGPQKYRLCSIALGQPATRERIVKAKSLLDDFAESRTIARKLALLDDITRVYREDELPPEASWLLAMKLLEPHLTWHDKQAGHPRSGSGSREQGAGSKATDGSEIFDPAVWPEAHSGEPWMREGRAYWRLDERRHVDVLHAMKLLARPGANAADDERRKRWLTEIDRNNTLLRMVVEPLYRPQAEAVVTLDVRNADRLMLKLYRVGNGAAWAAVRQRQGRDFIYTDAGAHFAAPVETAAGPKKLNQLMDDLVDGWTVEASKLPRNESGAQKRPAPEGEASWYGNRKLAIPAKDLAKSGYYVLAVEANGETAFAPLRVEEGKPGS